MNTILLATIVLGGAGFVLSVVLYAVSRKFAVEEDVRIKEVCEMLPGANCGGCGFPGCEGMSAACVVASEHGSLGTLLCPVGGKSVMDKISAYLGVSATVTVPKVAVVCCGGSCEIRPRTRVYDGLQSCKVAHITGMGESECAYGCLGCGDCVSRCAFGGLSLNRETGLPEVDLDLCTGCGACAKACPRGIIRLYPMSEEGLAVVVKCVNRDKGIAAKQACERSCIGCKICEKQCGTGAVTVKDNVAYIDGEKCTLCRECETRCPRGAIVAVKRADMTVNDETRSQD